MVPEKSPIPGKHSTTSCPTVKRQPLALQALAALLALELLKLEVILLHPLLFLNYLDGSQLAYAKKPKAKGQHRPDCK